MVEIVNEITLNGIIGADDETITDSASASVSQVEATLEKSANPTTWLGGDLVYTITFTNNEAAVGGLPIRDITITDQIDINIVELDETSINIVVAPGTATTSHSYNEATGALVFNIDSLDPQSIVTITFHVTKIQP